MSRFVKIKAGSMTNAVRHAEGLYRTIVQLVIFPAAAPLGPLPVLASWTTNRISRTSPPRDLIRFTIRNSQFAIRNSQFAIRNSQFAL
jgi:hypothetical protein